MKRFNQSISSQLIPLIGLFVTNIAYALPFSILPNGDLPSMVPVGGTAPASYTIKNNTNFNAPYNFVKQLPPNVQVNPTDSTCSPASGFQLAPGESCILNLTISGPVQRSNSNPNNHLFVCMSDQVSCAGPAPENALNIAQVTTLEYYNHWVKNLSSFGYSVGQGNIFLVTDSVCPQLISVFDSCFDNNPAAPYIVPQPPIENTYVNPYYAVPFNTPGPDGATTNIFYRLSNDEALVTVLSYPPKAAYFGYQSYLFSSETSNYPISLPLQVLSPDPNRYEIFGSLGNNINNTIVQNTNGTPWDGHIIVYITTSNQDIAQAIVANAVAHNIESSSIFIEPVGSNVITGSTSETDDLVSLMRYAIPESSTAGATWIDTLDQHVFVYKVSNATLPVTRYGTNEYTARLGTTDETSLTASLNQVAVLLQTYLASIQSGTVDIEPTVASTLDNASLIPEFGFVGSTCIKDGTICNGDNMDTSTYAVKILATLGENETAFIAGVNHNELNNASYISLGISNASLGKGVASSSQTNADALGFNSGVLTGSAEAVLNELGITVPDALKPELPYLYITFISRNCSNPDIVNASDYCINLEGDSLLSLTDRISIFERSYIKPGTTTGGNVNVMQYPLIIAAEDDF